MKILKRLGYYLGGFSIGLILLAFFIKGSKTSIPSCDYMPTSRVLKNIRTKGYTFSENTQELINQKIIDTATISTILHKGKVDFSESNARLEPCAIYIVKGKHEEKNIKLHIENCENHAIIKEIELD